MIRLDGAVCSCGDGHPLNADEFHVCRLLAFYFQAKFDCFTNSHHEFVERGTVRVASWQFGNRGQLYTFLVPLDHNIKLAHNKPSLQLRELPVVTRVVRGHTRPFTVKRPSPRE